MEDLINKFDELIEVFTTNANLYVTEESNAGRIKARRAAREISKLTKEFRKLSLEKLK